MSGPEQLDAGPGRSPRRAVWVVAAVVVVVLAVGVVLDHRRLEQSTPVPTPSSRVTQPAPSPPSRTPRSSPGSPGSPIPSAPITVWQGNGEDSPLTAGLPAGTLYARSSGTLYVIDLGTGAAVITPIGLATTDAVSMVATGDGVVLRPWDDTPGLYVRDGRRPVELPGLLRTARDILPGPTGHLWVLAPPDDAPMDTAATLVDHRGRRDGPRFTTPGNSYSPDGNGGLLLNDVGGVWQTYPQPLQQVTTGSVTGVGQHHYQLLECDPQHRCTQSLLDRRNLRRTPLSTRDRTYGDSLISPNGTLIADLSGYQDSEELRTAVTRLADNQTLQKLPEPPNPFTSQPGSIAWLSDQWLAVITDGHLAFYDTTHNRVLTPNLGFDNLLQFAWQPT